MSAPETRDAGGAQFHYNRAERLGYDPETESSKRQQSFFKRNRSLVIILLDIAIVLIVFALYLVFLAPDHSTARIGAHEVRLRAVEFGSEILLTLAVSAAVPDETDDSRITGVLEFIVTDDTGTELLRRLDTVPSAREDRVFREVLQRGEVSGSHIRAILRIADQEVQVHTAISRE